MLIYLSPAITDLIPLPFDVVLHARGTSCRRRAR